jgi:hypothetical protein
MRYGAVPAASCTGVPDGADACADEAVAHGLELPGGRIASPFMSRRHRRRAENDDATAPLPIGDGTTGVHVDEFAERILGVEPGDALYYGCFTADARFCVPKDDPIEQLVTARDRRIHIRTATLWRDEELNIPVPRGLVSYAFCSAPSIADAADFMYDIIAETMTCLAVAANAWCEMPREVVVADVTRDRERRAVRRRPNTMPQRLPQATRLIDGDASAACWKGLVGTPRDADAKMYAAQQYLDALDRRRTGNVLMSVEHLFIAAEAMKPIVLARHLEQTGLSRADLAAQWGVTTKQLEGEARLRLIFDGDKSTSDDARNASDGFEHGTLMPDETWMLARRCHKAATRYVRTAILRLAGLEGRDFDVLTGPYGEPLFDTEPETQLVELATTRKKILTGAEKAMFALRHEPFHGGFDDATRTYRYIVAWRDLETPGLTLPMEGGGTFTAFMPGDDVSTADFIKERLTTKKVVVEDKPRDA